MITRDGCAVDFYARMTAMGEPEIVHDAAGPGTWILELGCGTGRITHPLVALGHPVVAVDESPEMLAYVRGAETVRARIEDLALGRRFDVVLLASHLINTDDIPARTALLAACRRHVADDGSVIIQQHAPGWFPPPRTPRTSGTGSSSGCGTCHARHPTWSRPRWSTWTATRSGRRRSRPGA